MIPAGGDSKDALLMIATCSFHLKKFKDGENAIMALRTFSDVSLEDTIRSLDATHLLAEIYISSDRLGDARIECQEALQKKRRTIGKDSWSYYRTLGLRVLIEAAAEDHVSVEVDQEILRKAISDGLLRYSPGEAGKEELDDDRVENLRGLCPIKAALGLEEITRSLNASGYPQRPTDPQRLLLFAVDNNSCAALGLLLTAWSPTSYLHHIPEYTRVHGVGPWVGDLDKGPLLYRAAYKQNIEMVEILINAGASIYGRDRSGRTPYERQCAHYPQVTSPVLFNLLRYGKRVV